MSQQNDKRIIKIVNLCDIHIPEFQRHIDYVRAKKIANNFNMLKFDLPILYKTNNGYGVIDGNHRIAAAKIIGMKSCECAIVSVTDEEAAKLFYTQNENKKTIKPYDAFKAKLIAKTPEALDILNVIIMTGYRIDSKGNDAMSLCAISAIEKIYEDYSSQGLKDVLEIISKTWPGDEKSKRWEMLRGVALFIDICKRQNLWNKSEVIRKLSTTSTIQILQNASARTINGSGKHVLIAEVLVEIYNKKRKESSKLKYIK